MTIIGLEHVSLMAEIYMEIQRATQVGVTYAEQNSFSEYRTVKLEANDD